MKIEMKLDKAHKIVKDVVTARKRWGRQASLPYTMEELMDALMLLSEAGNFDAPTAEEVTKLKRQLAACQNREKARAKRDEEVLENYPSVHNKPLDNDSDPAGAAFGDPAIRAEIEKKLLGIGEEKQD